MKTPLRPHYPESSTRWTVFASLLVFLLLHTVNLHAQQTARWLGGSGDWSDPAKWDLGVVPHNEGGSTYIAVVDLPTESATITVSTAVVVSGLVNTEMLVVDATGDLTLSGGITNHATLTASIGTVLLNGATIDNTTGTLEANAGVIRLQDTELNGGTLLVADAAESAIRFHGEITLNGTVWADPGAGEFQVRNTTAQFLGDFASQLPTGHTLVIWSDRTYNETALTFAGGEYVNDGTIELRHSNASYHYYPALHWESSGTLSGSGEILMSGSGGDTHWTGADGVTVTIGPDQTVHGRGTIQVPVVNQGTLDADLEDRTLQLIAGLDNQAMARASVGTLSLLETVTQVGTLTAEGGTVHLQNAVASNTGRAIEAQGGVVLLEDSTVTGGILRVTDSADSLIRFKGDITLNSLTWDDPGEGAFQVYNTEARLLGDYANGLQSTDRLLVWSDRTYATTRLILAGGLFTNDGFIELRHSNASYHFYPALHWEASGTLGGSGEVLLSGLGGDTHWTGVEGVTVTIGPDQWIHGRGFLQLDLVNNGTLEADLSDRRLQVQGTTENFGTMRALSGGTLNLAGGLTQSGQVEIQGSGGLTLGSTVTTDTDLTAEAGSTLHALDTTVALQGNAFIADAGTVLIENSSLDQGTLQTTSDEASRVRFSGEVTMTDVAWVSGRSGSFQIYNTEAQFLGDYASGLPSGTWLLIWSDRTYSTTRLSLAGGPFTNDGTIELRHSNASYHYYPALHWLGSGTLEGFGEIYMSGLGGDNHWTAEEGTTVTIGPDQWVHGRGDLQIDLVNQGILEADLADKRLRVTGTTDNSGTISSILGGSVTLAGGLTNSGIIDVQGEGGVTLSGPISTDTDITAIGEGTLHISEASFALQGHTLTADGGVVLIENSSVDTGTLLATDDPTSAVRFSGDVTLTDVVWEDPGAGEFQVYNASARFLGDYADTLPEDYVLVIYANRTYEPTGLIVDVPIYTNDGTIELRHENASYHTYPTLHWSQSGTLTGSGQIVMGPSGGSNRWTASEGAIVTIGPDQWVHGRGRMDLNLVNEGLVEADLSNQGILIVGSVHNSGTLRTHPDTWIEIRGDLTNDDLIQLLGGNLIVDGSLILGDGGVLDVQDQATIRLSRHLLGDSTEAAALTDGSQLILDGAGEMVPDLSSEAFFVEAEDFNTNRGQHQPEADTMPYLGGAYAGEAGRDRIDFHVTANDLSSDLYRTDEGPSLNVNIWTLNQLDRGSYLMQTNFYVGRNDPDEWYNYTRTLPEPALPRYLFARLASTQPCAIQVDQITGSASTPSQTLNRLGEIRGVRTANASTYAYAPLLDDAGEPVPLLWSGDNTFRASILEHAGQSLDCFVLASAATSGPFQIIEVMGDDDGGFHDNPVLESITLGSGAKAQLVDNIDNVPGEDPEALYVLRLTVPGDAVLDLNGLPLYVQEPLIDGTVINGSIIEVSPEPPLLEVSGGPSALEIRWPTTAGSFELQYSDALGPDAIWEVVPGEPILDGADYLVPVTPSASQRLYRLARP